jgi:hypothetical protein
LEVRVAYTDDFNQPQAITKTLELEVMDMPELPPEGEGFPGGEMPPEVMPEPTESWRTKLWRFFLGMVGLSSGPTTPATDGGMPPFGPEMPPVDGGGNVAPSGPFRG